MSGRDNTTKTTFGGDAFNMFSRVFLFASLLLAMTAAIGFESAFGGVYGAAAENAMAAVGSAAAGVGAAAGGDAAAGVGAAASNGAATDGVDSDGARAGADRAGAEAGKIKEYYDQAAAVFTFVVNPAEEEAAAGTYEGTNKGIGSGTNDETTGASINAKKAPFILPDFITAYKILSRISAAFSFLNGAQPSDPPVEIIRNSLTPGGATEMAQSQPAADTSSTGKLLSYDNGDAAGKNVGDSMGNAKGGSGIDNSAGYSANRSFPAVGDVASALYDFSSGVSATHNLLLEKRASAISYARQLSAAKYLAQSAYMIKIVKKKAFIDEYGKSAGDLSEKEIADRFGNDYFITRLRELGFYKDDGNYSSDVNRRNGIIRAQSAFNIPITAKIDLNLKRGLIEGSDFIPIDKLPADRPDGMWVVIDKSARILSVYIGDEIFKKYPVAVGASIDLTPEGKFSFVSKAVNPRWGGGGYAEPIAGGAPNNPLGKRWMGLSIGGGGRYGVHGNVSPYSIGTNASHGCIRMINPDVEELYEHIKIGTPVWIGTTSKLAEWGVVQGHGNWEPDLPDYLDYLPKSAFYEE